jgi:hypothetical protein
MNRILESLQHLLEPLFAAHPHSALDERDEAYLAESGDIFELERRMEEVDRRISFGGSLGGYDGFLH